MQKVICLFAFVLMLTTVVVAQEVTVYGLFRTGVKADGGLTYNFAEIDLQKKRVWFVGGVIAFPDGRTAEIYGGPGYDFVSGDKFYLNAQLLFDKEVGSHTRGAVYVDPVILTGGKLAPKVKWQVYIFPYLPLNDQGVFQFVLERAQAWRETKVGNLGGGLGMYCAENLTCQPKPFVSFAPALWDRKVQIWYQRNIRTGQDQIQIRFFGKLWDR